MQINKRNQRKDQQHTSEICYTNFVRENNIVATTEKDSNITVVADILKNRFILQLFSVSVIADSSKSNLFPVCKECDGVFFYYVIFVPFNSSFK